MRGVAGGRNVLGSPYAWAAAESTSGATDGAGRLSSVRAGDQVPVDGRDPTFGTRFPRDDGPSFRSLARRARWERFSRAPAVPHFRRVCSALPTVTFASCSLRGWRNSVGAVAWSNRKVAITFGDLSRRPRFRVAADERRVSGLPLRNAPRPEARGVEQPGLAPGRSLRRGTDDAGRRLGIAVPDSAWSRSRSKALVGGIG
jgi:hypothetical protein